MSPCRRSRISRWPTEPTRLPDQAACSYPGESDSSGMRESVELREEFLYRLVSRPCANEVHGLRDMFLAGINSKRVFVPEALMNMSMASRTAASNRSPDGSSASISLIAKAARSSAVSSASGGSLHDGCRMNSSRAAVLKPGASMSRIVEPDSKPVTVKSTAASSHPGFRPLPLPSPVASKRAARSAVFRRASKTRWSVAALICPSAS